MDIQQLLETLNFSSVIWQVVTPIVFMAIDILTGIIQAIINKNLDSSVMRKGLLHKVLLIIIETASFIIDLAFNLPYVSNFICIYIILMEITSILENLKKAGIDLGKITTILVDKGGKNESK